MAVTHLVSTFPMSSPQPVESVHQDSPDSATPGGRYEEILLPTGSDISNEHLAVMAEEFVAEMRATSEDVFADFMELAQRCLTGQ